MVTLVEQRCVPYANDDPPMAPDEITTFRAQVSNWHVRSEENVSHLERFYDFPDFSGALAFATHIGEIAEKEGHYPVLKAERRKVTVTWWTPEIRGLHQNDFIMAAKTDQAYMGEV